MRKAILILFLVCGCVIYFWLNKNQDKNTNLQIDPIAEQQEQYPTSNKTTGEVFVNREADKRSEGKAISAGTSSIDNNNIADKSNTSKVKEKQGFENGRAGVSSSTDNNTEYQVPKSNFEYLRPVSKQPEQVTQNNSTTKSSEKKSGGLLSNLFNGKDNSSNNPVKDNRDNHKLNKLFQQTTIPSQYFTIGGEKESLLQSRMGTRISIPSNCFIQKDGREVEGKIDIELKEFFTTPSLLLANLPTVSEFDRLISDGVLYINATVNGKPLKMKYGKSIYVEMPTPKRDGKMWIYYGEHDKNGNLKWVAHSRQLNKLIPVPLESLRFEEANLPDDLYKELTDKKYENTLVATREFEERLFYIQHFCDVHGKRIRPILEYYFRNLNSNMADIDHKLHRYFKSLIEVEPYQEGEYVKELNAMSERFKNYYEEILDRPADLTAYRQGLNETEVFTLLTAQVGKKKAGELLQLYKVQQGFVHQRSDNANRKPYDPEDNTSKNTFFVYQTGWINIDRHHNGQGPKTNLTVKVMGQKHRQPDLSVYLVFKDYRMILPLSQVNDETFSINWIPKDEEAYLLALGYKDKQPYIDLTEIVTGQNNVEHLSMRTTTLDMLNFQISQIRHVSPENAIGGGRTMP